MRWSLGDLAGKREPCKLQGKADPLKSHIVPGTEGVSVGHESCPVGCSRVWPAPNPELCHPQRCFILTLHLRCVIETSRKALAGRREMENAGFVPPALPAAKDEAFC